MDSWPPGWSNGESACGPSGGGARVDRSAEGWPLQGAMLDGASPLQVRAVPAPPTVQLAGDIDEQTYPDLTDVLAVVARTGQRRIRFDLADIDYCDLAGLRAIITVADGQDRVEQVILVHVPDFLRAVLRVLGWDTTRGLIVEDEAR